MSGTPPAVALSDVCEVRKGTSITQAKTRPGRVPVVAGGMTFAYTHDESNRAAGVVTVSASGANAGFVNYWGVPIFASDCTTIEPLDSDVLDRRFTYHRLKSLEGMIQQTLAKGSAQPHVYPRDLATIEIPLPPIEEQRRIAAMLDAADELRVKRRQALDKLDELVQAVFLDIFGNPAVAASQFGCLDLTELGEMANGHNFTAADRGDGTSGLLMLDVKNMYAASTHPDVRSAYRVSAEVPESKQLQAGDLVFVRSSVKREGVAWPAHFPGHTEPVAFCGFLIRLRLSAEMTSQYIPEYLVHYLRQPAVRMAAVASAGQVAITNVSQERLGRLQIPKAPLSLQMDFLHRVTEISSLRADSRKSTGDLHALFGSLQQRAFRGEL